ncbi:sodium/potassium-transporting ATPase subunit beta-2 [Anopheles moucheti]|uniref:sodium/potassium-transporting ATPase subunit beta-2 n=1 Tax=Anopheles moucheti TaxID=186751 RepID=UPI0022F06633|nr:sodium/potassium-transporting ATPase subunit beta-2 [Anopheles moucheti]XP_052897010.1 sodium/potassium-transporting ATPase subunit beta-2 [Anopheles moucheti]XP_053662211.1 sodium/potassium-transporting ATPase subunit beta-2 [Anopheles marshallii]
MADKKVAEQYYAPPPKMGKWEGFKTFLWNSETSQCLGRTGSSWAKILFFYVCFYAALVGFFAAMLAVFWQTLDMQMPKYQLDSSLIGSNPGLGFRPTPPEYQNVESSLIWYRASDNGNVEIWTKLIDEFLKPYTLEEDNRVDCSFDNPPPEGKVCKVPMTNWSPCVKENRYNFKKKSPCIFLKLNKIYNWVPDMYNTSINLPEKMPDDLKEHIRGEEARGNKNTNVVWVSCAGENPADNEHIGAIQYIPRRGFPGYFFPYKNVDGYLPPVVAVYFEKPKTGVLINIECKAWARNIMYDRAERRGSVHFELMID